MRFANIWQLGIKEMRGLAHDHVMLLLIAYVFTFAIYTQATVSPETLNLATISVVDEDRSQLSSRIAGAFYPPRFTRAEDITAGEMDRRLDQGTDTFALDIPPHFERDVLNGGKAVSESGEDQKRAGRKNEIMLNVDATRVSQAFTGAGYIQQIVSDEVNEFLQHYRSAAPLPVDLALRVLFNPNMERIWFGAVTSLIAQITMLSVVLTGAALIREREHGTVEHLLVMPVTPTEIMISKIWSMGLVVWVAASLSLHLVVRGVLQVPTHGSLPLFGLATALQLYATTALGIALATLAESMPQFALLLVLVLLPMQVLSGATTPRESMPQIVQNIMLAAPDTHFVMLCQAILFRGAGIDIVWPQLLALFGIGTVLFAFALWRFRKVLS
jgi:ABC-2 type transport system permease protein